MADKEFRYLVASDTSGSLGFAILHETWLRPQNLYLKRIAVHDAGKGHGKRVLAALTDFVFAQTPTHRFWLEVVEANPRARHVYRSLGWTEEGIVREGFEDKGARGSFVQMSILKSEMAQGHASAARAQSGDCSARDLERSVAFYEAARLPLDREGRALRAL